MGSSTPGQGDAQRCWALLRFLWSWGYPAPLYPRLVILGQISPQTAACLKNKVLVEEK